jgi:large subunit ribosomal protein L6
MSRVGKLPVVIPDNIEVTVNNNSVSFESGSLKKIYKLSLGVSVVVEDSKIKVFANKSLSKIQMFVGMDRSNIKNILTGLEKGFKAVLEVNGVGYKASVDKKNLILTLGYSHEIFYALPLGITATFEKPNLITILGDDNILVGQVAAEIISFRKPEPYKGKGVKIFGRKIIRKEGKKK